MARAQNADTGQKSRHTGLSVSANLIFGTYFSLSPYTSFFPVPLSVGHGAGGGFPKITGT